MIAHINQESMLHHLQKEKIISDQLFQKTLKIRKFHMKMLKKLGLHAPTKDSLTKLENNQPSLYPLHLIGQYASDPYEAKWRDLMDFFQKIKIKENTLSFFIDSILINQTPLLPLSSLPDGATIKHIIRIGYDLIKNE